MPYFAIDDHWWAHDKTIQMTDGAQALWARAGSWAAGHLTDGFVPDHVLPVLRAKPRHVSELIRLNLWLKTTGGYTFQGWADHQPTKEDVERKRRLNRERQRQYRAAKQEQSRVTDTVTNDVTDNVTNGVSHAFAGHVSHATQTQTQTQPRPNPNSSLGPQQRPKTQQGTRLPERWMPSPENIQRMSAEHPTVDLRMETAQFTDYWTAKTGKDATKRDWDATWRNWIRRAATSGRAAQATSHGTRAADRMADTYNAVTQWMKPTEPEQQQQTQIGWTPREP